MTVQLGKKFSPIRDCRSTPHTRQNSFAKGGYS